MSRDQRVRAVVRRSHNERDGRGEEGREGEGREGGRKGSEGLV